MLGFAPTPEDIARRREIDPFKWLLLGRKKVNGVWSDLYFPWPFDGHVLNFGNTGSGKSSWAKILLHRLAFNPNVQIVFADLKFATEAEPWRPRCSALAADAVQAMIVVEQISLLLEARGQLLNQLGHTKWTEELGPVVVFFIDEMAQLFQEGGIRESQYADPVIRASMESILERFGKRGSISATVQAATNNSLVSMGLIARALGVKLVCSTQRPLAAASGGTMFREQLDVVISGRCESARSASIALTAAGTMGGLQDEDIRSLKPGQAWIEGSGRWDPFTTAKRDDEKHSDVFKAIATDFDSHPDARNSKATAAATAKLALPLPALIEDAKAKKVQAEALNKQTGVKRKEFDWTLPGVASVDHSEYEYV